MALAKWSGGGHDHASGGRSQAPGAEDTFAEPDAARARFSGGAVPVSAM